MIETIFLIGITIVLVSFLVFLIWFLYLFMDGVVAPYLNKSLIYRKLDEELQREEIFNEMLIIYKEMMKQKIKDKGDKK